MRASVVYIVVVLVLCVVLSSALKCDVNIKSNKYSSLKDAIKKIPDETETVVCVSDKFYKAKKSSNIDADNLHITIKGKGIQKTKIDLGGNSHFLSGRNCKITLRDLTLKQSSDSLIDIHSCELTLYNVRIKETQSDKDGSMIRAINSEVKLFDVKMENGVADEGGAVYLKNCDTTIHRAYFSRNDAYGLGPNAYSGDGSSSSSTSSSWDESGSCVYARGGSITIQKSHFYKNYAAAVQVINARGVISKCLFQRNTMAVSLRDSPDFTVRMTAFWRNSDLFEAQNSQVEFEEVYARSNSGEFECDDSDVKPKCGATADQCDWCDSDYLDNTKNVHNFSKYQCCPDKMWNIIYIVAGVMAGLIICGSATLACLGGACVSAVFTKSSTPNTATTENNNNNNSNNTFDDAPPPPYDLHDMGAPQREDSSSSV